MVSHAFSATVLATLIAAGASAQTPISFDREYSGRIDCAFIGNSHSVVPYPSSYCPTLDETTANLAMPAGATVVSATIYWSTSGDNDRWIKLNGEWVESEQTWDQEIGGNNLRFYGQKADVTSIVSAAGSGEYEVDRLDFDTYPYCQSGAAYGGWAMLVVYEDASLPLTEIDVFEGFIGVFNAYGSGNGEIETTLTGLHFPTECAVHATFKHAELGRGRLQDREVLHQRPPARQQHLQRLDRARPRHRLVRHQRPGRPRRHLDRGALRELPGLDVVRQRDRVRAAPGVPGQVGAVRRVRSRDQHRRPARSCRSSPTTASR